MNRFGFGFLIALVFFGGFWFFHIKKQQQEELRASSELIQTQINQVGKLIVTEGYYSKVFTFKNSQSLFLNLWTSDKKALVVVNAKATVEYDLRQIETQIDAENKTLILKKIPEPRLNIYPEIEYYDVTQDYFNSFGAADYNKIKNSVTAQVRTQIEKSELMENAQDRLLAELTNFYILTKSLGWTLIYEDKVIGSEEELSLLKK
jgi:preprotein translocase subunit YajC